MYPGHQDKRWTMFFGGFPRLPYELEPEDDADERDEHDDDRARHDALLVHPTATCQRLAGAVGKGGGGAYLRIIFLSVPDARSMDVSAR